MQHGIHERALVGHGRGVCSSQPLDRGPKFLLANFDPFNLRSGGLKPPHQARDPVLTLSGQPAWNHLLSPHPGHYSPSFVLAHDRKEILQFTFNGAFAFQLTLPNRKHAPPQFSQPDARSDVTNPVTRDLFGPVFDIGFRNASAAFASVSMPETAVDEDH